MNVNALNQITEAPAVNAVAEAVRGLARDRSTLVKELKDASKSWMGYRGFVEEQAVKIAAIDGRIDRLLAAQEGERVNNANTTHG